MTLHECPTRLCAGATGFLTISLATRPAPGPVAGRDQPRGPAIMWWCSIADTGHGWSLERKSNIWSRSSDLPGARSALARGLGLIGVHGIASAFGGIPRGRHHARSW